jgi:hypothetical protein
MKNWRLDELRKELNRRKIDFEAKATKGILADLYIAAIKKEVGEMKKTEEVLAGELNGWEDNALEIVLREGIIYKVDSHCWWGKSSRVPEEEINAPKDIMTGVKTLVHANTLGSLRSFKSMGERIVKKNAYPFLGIRGAYYVPKYFIPGVEKSLKETQEKVYEERSDFIKNLPKYRKEWAAHCKKEKVVPPPDELYPNKAELERKIRFKWTKFAITVPDSNMGVLTDELYKEEVEKQKEEAKTFLNDCFTTLSKQFYGIIKNLRERLESDDAMKPKTLASVKDFIETFDAMNVTNNAFLKDMVAKTAKALKVESVKDLNSNEDLRTEINTEVGSLVKAFEKASTKDERLKRAIDF